MITFYIVFSDAGVTIVLFFNELDNPMTAVQKPPNNQIESAHCNHAILADAPTKQHSPQPNLNKAACTQRGQERRLALLKAANDLFLNSGYDEVSLDDIVQHAGGSKAAIYQYFGNKHGLLLAVIEARCQCFFETTGLIQLSTLKNFDQQPIRDVLLQLMIRLYDECSQPDNVAFVRLVIKQSQHDPQLAELAHAAGIQRGILLCAQILEQADIAGQLTCPNPQLSAIMLLGMLRHMQWRLMMGLPALEAMLADRASTSLQPTPLKSVELFLAQTIDCFIKGH